VQIDLTQSGLENYEAVVQVVFDYLSLVKVEEWIWREMQSLADVDFKFKEVSSVAFISRSSLILLAMCLDSLGICTSIRLRITLVEVGR
jgi:insulysin